MRGVEVKKCKKLLLAACLFLICLLAFIPFIYIVINAEGSLTPLIRNESHTYLVFSNDIVFKIPAYGTVIKFDENFKFTKFEWDQWNATMILFYDLQMDGDLVSKFGVSVKNANLTIVDLFVNKRLNITAELLNTANCTIKIHADGFKPCNVSVHGADLVSWSYDNSSDILTIIVSPSSFANVIVDWKEFVVVTPEPSPPPDTSPPSEPSPEPPSETPPSEPPPQPSCPFLVLLGELKSIAFSFSVLLPVLITMLAFVMISIRLRRGAIEKGRARSVVKRKLLNTTGFSSGMGNSTIVDNKEEFVVAFRKTFSKPTSKKRKKRNLL